MRLTLCGGEVGQADLHRLALVLESAVAITTLCEGSHSDGEMGLYNTRGIRESAEM